MIGHFRNKPLPGRVSRPDHLRSRTTLAPRLEDLERRELLTLTFGVPVAIGGAAVEVHGTAVDAANDTYLTGVYSGTVAFGPETSDTATAAGAVGNPFVAKYDAAHDLVWLKTFPGGTSDQPATIDPGAITVDPAGNVYVAGLYSGAAASFDQEGGEMTAAPRGIAAFVVKLDPSGNVGPGMVRTYDSLGTDTANAITFDPTDSSLYIAGSMEHTVDFNPGGPNGSLSATTPPPGGDTYSGYVLKLSSDLGFGWVAGGAATPANTFSGVAVDGQDHVFTVGVVDHGGPVVLTKYDASGQVLKQAETAAGIDDTYAPMLAVDAAGDPYVAGTFGGTHVNFNTDPGQTTTLSASSVYLTVDAFLAKFDGNLNLTWARRFGSNQLSGETFGTALAVDPMGVAYLGGILDGAGSFGTNADTDPVVLNPVSASENGYVLSVDPAGNFQEGQTFDPVRGQTTGTKLVDQLVARPTGDVLLVGNYVAPFRLANDNFASPDSQQVYFTPFVSTPTPIIAPTPTAVAPFAGSTPPPTSPPTTTPPGQIPVTPTAPNTPTIPPIATTPTTPTVPTTPTSPPTPTVYAGPIVIFPAITAATATHDSRGITAIRLALSGSLPPSFHAADFTARAASRLFPRRFAQALKVQSVTFDAATHSLVVHLARPHRGAVQVGVRAGAVRSAFGGAMISPYHAVVP